MLPADYEMQVADQGTPEFPAAMKDAEYLVGFARESFGPEFDRGAPKLKLIQLISAGYDRLDIAAARQAKVPVANNGGANSVAVAEHTLMLILAVYKEARLASPQRHHRQVARRRLRADPDLRAGRQDAWDRRPRDHRQEGREAGPGLRHARAVLRHRPPHRARRGRARRPLRAVPRAPAHLGRGQPARAPEQRHARDDGRS